MLYIRSQDNTALAPMNKLVLSLDDCNGVLEPKIIADTYNHSYILGVYSSVVKALQVMDEIQKVIQLYNNGLTYDSSILNYKDGVYTMPSE